MGYPPIGDAMTDFYQDVINKIESIVSEVVDKKVNELNIPSLVERAIDDVDVHTVVEDVVQDFNIENCVERNVEEIVSVVKVAEELQPAVTELVVDELKDDSGFIQSLRSAVVDDLSDEWMKDIANFKEEWKEELPGLIVEAIKSDPDLLAELAKAVAQQFASAIL